MKKKLFIFSNESVFLQNNKYFCENIDIKTTPEGLNKNFEVNLFCRKSPKKKTHEIKLKKIKIFSNLLSYLLEVIRSSKIDDAKYLVVSISPYTFFIFLFLKFFRKTPMVYLRSDGYGEYKAILGKLGTLIYHLMFNITSFVSNFISCRNYILKGKKGEVVQPSQLDTVWLRKPKILEVKSFKLLYVGRIRVEKGIYSLAKLIKNKHNISLTIVGAEKQTSYKINQSNIKIYPTQANKLKLIKYYDENNIFVLPSFTEGHPMVLLEALARRRPVVIFEEIKHVIGDKKGVFVSRRNYSDFLKQLITLKKIINLYKKIWLQISFQQTKNLLNNYQKLLT